MERHESEVALISARLKHFYADRAPFRVYHGSTNSTRPSDKTRDNTVDTSRLDHVLEVDTASRIATVEPNVSMSKLARETVKHGLIPPVVMELPSITAGGGFSGTSAESSSFRYGVFDATVEWIEIVLPDGEVMRASKSGENKDLFWGAASAFGTFGIVTLLGIQLIPAGEYVRLEYHLCSEFEEVVEKIKQETRREEIGFVDGIVFAKDRTAICAGYMVDGPLPDGQKPRRFTRPRDNWFYLRADEVSKKLKKSKSAEPIVDYIPLRDYLFRYDRGAFWTARYAFKYFITPFNRVSRFLLDRFLHTDVIFAATHKSELANYYITQDVSVPMDTAVGFSAWLDDTYGIYPLWLCPLRVARDDEDSQHGIHAGFCRVGAPDVLNFGVWGPLSFDREKAVEGNRKLEAKVAELGGMKCLYAQTCYEEDEFWVNYDRASYDGLRAKYRSAHLPSVYDKVKRDVAGEEARKRKGIKGWAWGVWPVKGLYGVYKVIRGGDYLLQDTDKELAGSAEVASKKGNTEKATGA